MISFAEKEIKNLKSLLISRIKSLMNKKNHKESIEFLEKIKDIRTFPNLLKCWGEYMNVKEEIGQKFYKFIHNN
jgi:hypothetical protein